MLSLLMALYAVFIFQSNILFSCLQAQRDIQSTLWVSFHCPRNFSVSKINTYYQVKYLVLMPTMKTPWFSEDKD